MDEKLLQALQAKHEQIDELRQLASRDRTRLAGWQASTAALLRRVGVPELAKAFADISYSPSVVIGGSGDTPFVRAYLHGLDKAESILIDTLQLLEKYSEFVDEPQMNTTPVGAVETNQDRDISNRVFVVHGHDEEAKQSVARTIEKLGLEPIILHEQPNAGRTIIEKFETFSDVSFAVVILSPDDLGKAAQTDATLQLRARQNVLLELGYFIGRLGRSKVCPLVKGDVELPSDMLGVVYVPMEKTGAWRFHMAKEMKAAGLSADLNKLA